MVAPAKKLSNGLGTDRIYHILMKGTLHTLQICYENDARTVTKDKNFHLLHNKRLSDIAPHQTP